MNNYIIFSDYNLFGSHDDTLTEDFVFGENVVFAGNIIDLASCKNFQIDKALLKLNELRLLAGNNYIAGEGEKYLFNIMLKKNGIIFSNSDTHLWPLNDTLTRGAFYLNEMSCETMVFCNPKQPEITEHVHQGFRFIIIPKGRTSLKI